VNIRWSDYLLIRFAQRFQGPLRRVGDWETRLVRDALAPVSIDRPIFITGLARSGTTLLLELLAGAEGVATHRYRDFPFLTIPYLWNRYLDWFPSHQAPVERAHRDRIYITRESPEALEEPIWRAFFPHLHSASALHRMTSAEGDPRFEAFYKAHIRKLLLIRNGRRYAAKGNYHVPRIEYLAQLFPDARFIIPVRNPLTHVDSLVRQHRLFSQYAQADARVPRYLEAAGHFEFGPQRAPIRLDPAESERILRAWSRGEEHLGYAIQWKELYGFAHALRAFDPALAQRILIVRYEDLCETPETTLLALLRHIELDAPGADQVLAQSKRIAAPSNPPDLHHEATRQILEETHEIAKCYGYSPERV
jgi:hypothetical protein